MSETYWHSLANQRLTRRRAIAGLGSAALGGAILCACGGTESGKTTSNASGLVTKPADSSKQAKRGGTLLRSLPADITTWDPALSPSGTVTHFEPSYSRLFGRKVGYMGPSQNEIVGDLAESWEWTPDRLQLTAKLRPGVKFHNLPPVNGRAMTMDDILFSWRRFTNQSIYRTIVANSANPDAPVLSFTAPDANTVVIKLKEPIYYVHGFFAMRSYVVIMPKEAEDPSKLDLRGRVIGTGPFMLDYAPSTSLTYRRNPDYWVKDQPYVDQVNHPLVREYASGLSQFRAGNIHTYLVRQEDVLATKRDLPELNMYEGDVALQGYRMFFGWQHPVVRDKRIRQAWSMAIDRDLMIEAEFNTAVAEQAGLKIEKRWNTALPADEAASGWWLDPKGKDFGPNSKYFKMNVPEVKKLLVAAGYPDGPEMISNFVVGGTGGYGPEYVKTVEIWESMAREAGFKITRKEVNYTTEFLPSIRDGNGLNFAGHSYKSGPPSPTSDSVNRLTYEYSKSGGSGFHGFDVAGKGDGSGDPYIEEQLHKARLEVDVEKRRQLVFDVQRYLADAQYCIRFPGGATTYDLVWPALRNYRVHFGGDALINMVNTSNWWLDDAQPPFKKA